MAVGFARLAGSTSFFGRHCFLWRDIRSRSAGVTSNDSELRNPMLWWRNDRQDPCDRVGPLNLSWVQRAAAGTLATIRRPFRIKRSSRLSVFNSKQQPQLWGMLEKITFEERY